MVPVYRSRKNFRQSPIPDVTGGCAPRHDVYCSAVKTGRVTKVYSRKQETE